MAVSEAGAGQPAAKTSMRRLWTAALLGGLIASGLSWGAGEASVGRFRTRQIDPLKEAIDLAGIDRVVVKNAALAHGLQGALLGLALGIAGGAARRPIRVVGPAIPIGLVAGGLLGALGSFGVFTAFHALADSNSPDLIPSLLAHAGLASLLGIAAGVAFGLGWGDAGAAGRAAIGGLLGAAIGAGLYEIVGGVLMPADKTGEPVATTSMARLLWHALVDTLAALGAASVAELPEVSPAPDPTPAAAP